MRTASTTGAPCCGTPTCPRLWERTSSELYREVAKAVAEHRQLRRVVRLSYMKVVEFQRRGLVHLHVVIRADGADGPSEPPPAWLGLER